MENLEEVVDEYTQKIDHSKDIKERKELRSERKSPKEMVKQIYDWIARKEKYEKDFETFGTLSS